MIKCKICCDGKFLDKCSRCNLEYHTCKICYIIGDHFTNNCKYK